MSLWGDGVFAGAPVPEEVLAALGRRPGRLDRDGSRYYWERLVAPETVYIFGGGHVSQALVPVLAAVEFRCVVLEDGRSLPGENSFQGRRTCAWPIWGGWRRPPRSRRRLRGHYDPGPQG